MSLMEKEDNSNEIDNINREENNENESINFSNDRNLNDIGPDK